MKRLHILFHIVDYWQIMPNQLSCKFHFSSIFDPFFICQQQVKVTEKISRPIFPWNSTIFLTRYLIKRLSKAKSWPWSVIPDLQFKWKTLFSELPSYLSIWHVSFLKDGWCSNKGLSWQDSHFKDQSWTSRQGSLGCKAQRRIRQPHSICAKQQGIRYRLV